MAAKRKNHNYKGRVENLIIWDRARKIDFLMDNVEFKNIKFVRFYVIHYWHKYDQTYNRWEHIDRYGLWILKLKNKKLKEV